jgi:hypothetical protein
VLQLRVGRIRTEEMASNDVYEQFLPISSLSNIFYNAQVSTKEREIQTL